MHRSLYQLSQAKVMKKNAILAFILFLVTLSFLIISTKRINVDKSMAGPATAINSTP